jgi:hypothetical protein
VRGKRKAQMYQQPQPLPKNLCTARLHASLRAAFSRSPQATKSRGAERRVSSEARRIASRVRGERNAQMCQQPQPLPKNLCTARLYASLRAASSRSPQATKSRGAERRVSSEARRIASRVRGERNAHIFAQYPPPPQKTVPQDCAPRPRRHCSRPEIYFSGSFSFLACWLFPMRESPRACKGNPREKYVSAGEGTCAHALIFAP